MTKTNFLKNYSLHGDILNIHTYPDPILTKKAIAVEHFDDHLVKLCEDMLFTMYHAPGIGLAAPQIGKGIRLFVLDVDYKREEITLEDGTEDYKLSKFNPQIFINPVIVEKNGETIYQEGCLSVPGVYEDVTRCESLTLEYQDLQGKKHQLTATGLLAICIQHEYDHLDGVVFIERLSAFKKNFFKKKLQKNKQTKNI
jgi:peptide deformylase